MSLPSFLQRKPKSPTPPRRAASAAAGAADDSGPVQQARTRARRRLIGAVVLLAVGIVGFPLLFETQPRPIAVDIPIETPRKDGGSVMPPPVAAPPAVRASAAVVTAAPAEEIIEPAHAPAKPPATAASTPTAAPAPKPAPSAAAPKPPVANDGQRAKALLDDKPTVPAASASAPGEARFVVQVGAYTDAAALRDARQKVEKLGLKTYTQVIETDAGKRTRVRVGPFATREEADRTSARLKAAGLPVAILTL
jgi:DedD protein